MAGTGAEDLDMSCGTGTGSLSVVDLRLESVLLKAGEVDTDALR